MRSGQNRATTATAARKTVKLGGNGMVEGVTTSKCGNHRLAGYHLVVITTINYPVWDITILTIPHDGQVAPVTFSRSVDRFQCFSRGKPWFLLPVQRFLLFSETNSGEAWLLGFEPRCSGFTNKAPPEALLTQETGWKTRRKTHMVHLGGQDSDGCPTGPATFLPAL